jgi:transcriptional regulator with XRE-family HTH domain
MKPETAHMIQILRTAIRVLGFTNREIEKQLGVSGGYLTRLFNGVMELRFEHIVDIARVIGLEPEEVFHLAYPQPRNPSSEAALRIRDSIPGLQPALQASAAGQQSTASSGETSAGGVLEQELERMMLRMFRKFFSEMAQTGSG